MVEPSAFPPVPVPSHGVPTGVFRHDELQFGLAALTKRDRLGDALNVPPVWRDKFGSFGQFGPVCGVHLRAADNSAAEQAYILAGRVDAADMRALFNTVSTGVLDMPTHADIRSVRGIPVKLPFLPVAHHNGFPEGYAYEDELPWAEVNLRFSRANAVPLYVFGYSPAECWAVWFTDLPDFLHGDVKRARAYNRLTRAFAEAVSGTAAPEPLLTTLPLPGACDVRLHGGGSFTHVPNKVLDLSAHGVRGVQQSYGARFEDLEAVLERIKAVPPRRAAA
ncbi:hypothetical protein [Methylobacterium sp. R2-1]|uniref:hypothetical protein n=1 Tax=Methylobacterium sp. R2-1 TaxID=2587064 RepID=UPI001611DC87|nr:hypothetical protein [Methylobacterium sp. R2-1]MBB2961822.1 hypothetical protein [Methylobacterium sp. R2-1]